MWLSGLFKKVLIAANLPEIFINSIQFIHSLMGFFDWFGRIFSRKEQVEVIVPFSDIEDWLEQNTDTFLDNSNSTVKDKYSQVLQKKEEASELLAKLAGAQLQNPHIEPRMLQFMTGNRENYMQQVQIFVNNLPELNNDFYAKFQQSLDGLAKKTARSYQILQEFFADESRSVAFKIKEMDALSKEINDLRTKGRMKSLNEIKSKISEIQTLNSLKEKMLAKIEADEAKLQQEKDSLEEHKKEIDGKKGSDEYRQYNERVQKREKLTVRLKMLDSEVNEELSGIKRALKKFRRINLSHENEVLIDSYLSSPLVGLIDDREFKLLELFKELKAKMNSLALDQKEEAKVRQKIKDITKEKLGAYLREYDELKLHLVDLKEKIEQSTVLNEIEKLQQDAEALERSIARKEIELQEEGRKLETYSIDEKTKELQLLINSSLGSNILIR
jgi:hypothetical protein